MIRRISIKDYMAHRNTDLELDPGVTVLTGPNNSGKSAVVEALRSVAQNPPPHHVIRHGASQAVVRVELASGEAIEWVRSRTNPVYRLHKAVREDVGAGEEPEVYAKFGRTPPEDIRRLLRLDPVETESGAVDIHIGNQRYPIFLLDQTGSQAASFFAASTEAEYLLRIQQTLKTKTDRARSKRKELLEECAEFEASLERYAPLTMVERELAAAEALHARLMAAEQAFPQLLRTIEVLEETLGQVDRKERSSALLEQVLPLPQRQETKGLEHTLGELQGMMAQVKLAAARATVLTPLSDPPRLNDTARLGDLIRAWESDEAILSSRVLAGRTLEGLDQPPALYGIKELEALVQELKRTEQSRKQSVAAREALESLAAPSELVAVMPLQILTEQLRATGAAFEVGAARERALEPLFDPPEPLPVRPLEELATALADVEGRLQGARKLGSLLGELTDPPGLQTIGTGEELLERMNALHEQLKANIRMQVELSGAMVAKRREIERTIQELGLCPLCGQQLDMEHFLEITHG